MMQLNAGVTVQILSDIFSVRGIVHYGTTGSANDSMSFGDVSIPKYVAFTGSWTWTIAIVNLVSLMVLSMNLNNGWPRWFGPSVSELDGQSMKFDSETKMANMLSFAAYNAPAEGKNLLSSVVFKSEDLFVDGKPMDQVFWLQMESQWYEIAKQLKVELQRCANESFCLPDDPKMVFGLKASTADVFIDNAAYRQFLFNEFGVSTVDQESAAVVQTAMASGIPVIVFRGVSDLAGGEATWSSSFLGDLACINALKAAVEFIGILGRRKILSSS
ncbi:Bark storage protein A [Dendrobium catenatum]|uniref:Bark storage protein A n=1 Tax=Dendrobium catenatum TaxID=906689 RepID=A0A2I0WBI6_9ASPA|nr:Bark storage protein A [Dendrobium catenatum]